MFRRWWAQKGKPTFDRFKPVLPSLLFLGLLFGWILLSSPENDKPDTVAISTYEADLASGKVKGVELKNDDHEATVDLKDGREYLVAYPDDYGKTMVETARAADIPLNVVGKGVFERYQLFFAIVVGLLFLSAYVLRYGGKSFASLRSSGMVIAPTETPKEKFGDVGGADEVIEEIKGVVDTVTNPEEYRKSGVSPVTGILLKGPPGTGKTLLARAIAGEAGLPFYSINGADFMGRYLNDGPRAVREVFSRLRKSGGGILFIDEFDTIGSKRSENDDSGSKELNNTLNALLTEMDGFETNDDVSILVIAATNRAGSLDPGVLRPGRFTRHYDMPTPDPIGRRKVLEIHTRKLTLAEDVLLERLVKQTSGMSGAQLKDLANEAGLRAIKRAKLTKTETVVTMADFLDALETIQMGVARKSRVITRRDQEITAGHEGGHALVAFYLEHAERPNRVTIVPRGMSGGHTGMDEGDWLYLTRAQLYARIACYMAGRAAEKLLMNGEFTTSAESDIEAATRLATYMVTKVGMGAKYTAQLPFGTGGQDPRIAEVTEEIDKLVKQGEETALALLTDHREDLLRLRDKLLEVESLDGETLAEMFGEPVNA